MTAKGLNADGVRLFDQARYPEAMEQFQKAIDNDPSSADAYYNLASAYHRQATLRQRPADATQAENYYNLCLARDANHRDCHRGLAVLLCERGRDDEAFRLLQAWADREPISPDPKVELARLSEEFGDRQAARRHLTDALHLDAGNSRALAALGHLHEQSGNHAMAMQDYQQSLQANRFQPDVAARVAALQATGGSQPLATSPSSGSRTVTRPHDSLH